jgi:hypothetical protein
MATAQFTQERHSQRHKVILPITLVANATGQKGLVPASALDFSSDGLRIQTTVRLSVGQTITVEFEKGGSRRTFKVVWAKSAGALQPGQAGLISLTSDCECETSSTSLPELEPVDKAA